ncbi:MAG: penicillin-binding protein 1C [Kiritimatiellia bacterium]|jgi:penicillin-binding protein 1C
MAPDALPPTPGSRHSAIARRAARWTALVALISLAALLNTAWVRAGLRAPPPTMMLLDRNDHFLGEVGEQDDERLGFWQVHDLPDRVIAATIAIEDRNFHGHPGVDVSAVARALWQNVSTGERVSGASTLAMQVARLQDPGPRTYPRKALEAMTALMLVSRHGRERVLVQYLTLAPYGNNVHGIEYAARRYFHKPVADLSWAEIALLTALPQAPGRMNPYTLDGRRRASQRARQVLDRLLEDDAMTAAVHQRSLQELDTLHFPKRPERPTETLHTVLHLERTLPNHLRDQPIVRTTLDLHVQRAIQQRLDEALVLWRGRGAGNAAAVVVERGTWQVVASVGSADWHDDMYAGSIDYARTARYPGSTLKPFIYGAALERGLITPSTILDDLGRGPDEIGNADERFLGPLLPRRALANSRNVPAVRLMERVGLDSGYGLYRDLGLHDDEVPVDHYGLGLAIGGMPLHLVDLVRAYTIFSADGELNDLRWYARQPTSSPRRILSPEHANAVASWLSDPMARLPTFPRMGHSELPFPAAIKTGTSPDFRDAWAIAWSERYIVGVWVGHPDWTPMQGLSGYGAGAQLTRTILLDLHADDDSFADDTFRPPSAWAPVQLCALTGQRATSRCDRVVTEWFAEDQLPQHDCDAHVTLQGRNLVQLPSRYSLWARRIGLNMAPSPGSLHGEDPVDVRILSPRDGQRVLRDPEAPAGMDTLLLQASVDPPVSQVVWYIDGDPVATVTSPYTLRWPVSQGEHTFEARAALQRGRSGVVTVSAL